MKRYLQLWVLLFSFKSEDLGELISVVSGHGPARVPVPRQDDPLQSDHEEAGAVPLVSQANGQLLRIRDYSALLRESIFSRV